MSNELTALGLLLPVAVSAFNYIRSLFKERAVADLKYKIGDEVLIRAKITDLDTDDDALPYLVESASGNLGEWIDEDDIVSDDSDDPINPQDFVCRKADPHQRVGKVIAIKKGEAWIDWAPQDPNANANGAALINVLRKLTPAELRQLAGV